MTPVAPAGRAVPYSSPYIDAPWYIPYYASPDYGMRYKGYAYQNSKEQRETIAEQRQKWDEIVDQRRHGWKEMMENRRKAWLEAEAARRKHTANTHDMSTAVLKRIEQGRSDMNRQIQEMNANRDQTDRRMREFRRCTDRTEI